ncbi:uncharacterized protein LOC120637691 isoform X2 [Pararge aegeria]|uniref:uncharacterized protein LOC120637691 isoform X2 n=1 Tax=Pararge aegeria TaxID=116150 RepID=UPI0019D2C4A8|nr:uncharacterized protein LOC120637691 isoform X2 [Pararge aegeria]
MKYIYSSTSLSKIFGSSSKEEDVLENNNSLKFIAPLPPQVTTKSEESKQTKFLYAGSVYAYEWVDNSYEFRGKLGFAIFSIINIDIHKMVIYNSNKTSLSSLTIAHDIKIKVNGNISISYYDNLHKFWSVNPSSSKLDEILDILRSLNVNLEIVPAIEEKEIKTHIKDFTEKDATTNKLNETEKESDTDVAFNRKTKDSILKRMATMGHSVLPPPHAAAVTQTSDSSDTSIPQNQRKPRHKPKIMNKKGPSEKKSLDTDRFCELTNQNTRKIPPQPEPHEMFKDFLNIASQEIVPVSTASIINPNDISADASSVGLIISEQKLSNSELRINMNRMADKVDILLDKVKDLEMVDRSKSTNNSNLSQFQNEIVQKLLNEYEKKINRYEEFMKLKGFDCENFELASQSTCERTQHSLKTSEIKETQIQQLCNDKDKEIVQLRKDLELLSNKAEQFKDYERNLLKEICNLKDKLDVSKEHIPNEIKKLDDADKQNTDITNKLKQIMNDTFQAISVNFDDEENYTGSQIKSIVGVVVKKTTIDSLRQLQST